jgi:hypothetical protein
MLAKQVEKKPLRGTYLVDYSNDVVNLHSLTNLDLDKEFEEIQQLISIIKIKEGRLFEITTLKKPRKAIKPSSKETKATQMVEENNEYSYDIKRVEKIFDQLMGEN